MMKNIGFEKKTTLHAQQTRIEHIIAVDTNHFDSPASQRS